MAKKVKTESINDSELYRDFSKFEMIALCALKGILANPGVLQLGLKPAEINEMVTTASMQIAEAMIINFDERKMVPADRG